MLQVGNLSPGPDGGGRGRRPLLAVPSALALDATDLPTDAPQDALMAGPAEIQEMQDWASAAFTGRRTPRREPAVRCELRRPRQQLRIIAQP